MENLLPLIVKESSPHLLAQDKFKQALRCSGKIYYPSTPLIDSYPAEEKRDAYERMQKWSDIVCEYHKENKTYTSTAGLFKYYMQRLGLQAHPQFTDTVKDGDILEVYGPHGKRWYFSPDLCDYSSYNPMDLYSTRWWELYERKSDITAYLMECMKAIFNGEINRPFKPKLENHIVSEVASQQKFQIEIEMISIAPVYYGKVVGAVASHNRFKML